MESFEKQPYEEFVIAADFVNVLEDAETIESGPTVTATDVDGEDAVLDIIDDTTISVSGSQVLVLVKAGVELSSPYQITFQCVTSNGNKWELDVHMFVREL